MKLVPFRVIIKVPFLSIAIDGSPPWKKILAPLQVSLPNQLLPASVDTYTPSLTKNVGTETEQC